MWVRPYTPGVGRWLVIGWEAVALAALGWTTVALFDFGLHASRLTFVALALCWLLGSVRIVRMGVYLGGRGVRIRGLLRSRTVKWHEIEHIRLHRSIHKFGGWEIPSGMTVLIERQDGEMINTELWAQGVDFHSRPGVFRAVYHELRDRHLAATRHRPRPFPA